MAHEIDWQPTGSRVRLYKRMLIFRMEVDK